ncbi:hypothetical protein H0I76_06050 [Limibaculum sp. M0105]|uniref:Uncharacterized protein n=1 Tax=Thermohalobaculum xanthum TaxID=2753746 RepID=A0A8J7SCM8_9RHOB|nr:hypothetical protein [Thermohalobaculum xanthum]MBK0398743.1 hypothetical protein [Thermohalobaculum xanthum]
MTDGDWNGSPDEYFQDLTIPRVEDDNMDTEDSIVLDLSSVDTTGYDLDAATLSYQIELEVIGDHNDPDGETLTIETIINDGESDEATLDTSVLLNDAATEGFWSGDVGPTSTGAQPEQGNLYILDSDGVEIRSTLPPGQDGGLDSFSDDTVDDIINEDAELFSEDGESASLSAVIGAEGVKTITLNLRIPEEDSPDDGVDISQTSATASLVVDFDSDKDISNMVFYFTSGDPDDGCLKLKIDEFDDFWEHVNTTADSTSTFDMMISDETLKDLFNDYFGNPLDNKYDLDGDGEWEDDWTFGGFSTKAGNNFDLEYSIDNLKKNARGEGEYIGLTSLAEDCYGKKEKVAFSIDAAYYDGTEWVGNIDDLFA